MTQRPLPKSVKILVDESEKGIVYMLGALEVTAAQERILVRRLQALQEDIKSRLLQRKPDLINDPAFRDGGLPELHGVSMAQSDEYYRHRKNLNPEYWKEHFVWYESALEIIRGVSPKFYFLQINSPIKKGLDLKFATDNTHEKLREAIIQEVGLVSDAAIEKFLTMLQNQYVHLLPKLMITMNGIMKSGNKNGILLCDNKDDCKGFSNLDLWKVLRAHNLHQHLSEPEFLSSDDSPLVQAADLVTYVVTQVSELALNPRPAVSDGDVFKRQFYERAYSKYIKPFDYSIKAAENRFFQELELSIASDMALELSVKAAHFSPNVVQAILDLGISIRMPE